MKTRACLLVRKCLFGESCENFKQYFQINSHERKTRKTRISNKFLKLPAAKLVIAEKYFKFFGEKVYNDLPLVVREWETGLVFDGS